MIAGALCSCRLKENSNFERLNLKDDFEICDDKQRMRILRSISSVQKITKTELEDFDRAISVFKLGGSDNIDEAKIEKLLGTHSCFINFFQFISRASTFFITF